jgi:hypothetical protein
VGALQLDDWSREVLVATTPDVDELRVGQPETVGDLRGADEHLGVDLPSHPGDVRRVAVDDSASST